MYDKKSQINGKDIVNQKFRVFTPKHMPKRIKNIGPHRNLYMNV